VTKHLALTAFIAAGTVAAALASGPHRKGALVGAISSSVTAVASLLFMQRGSRARKPLQAAMAVMAVMFLVRIVVVGVGTAAVVRGGESVVGFIVAFFVPFFIYAAIEIAWLLGLSRGPGPTA
jgi:hypothetical protein